VCKSSVPRSYDISIAAPSRPGRARARRRGRVRRAWSAQPGRPRRAEGWVRRDRGVAAARPAAGSGRCPARRVRPGLSDALSSAGVVPLARPDPVTGAWYFSATTGQPNQEDQPDGDRPFLLDGAVFQVRGDWCAYWHAILEDWRASCFSERMIVAGACRYRTANTWPALSRAASLSCRGGWPGRSTTGAGRTTGGCPGGPDRRADGGSRDPARRSCTRA